MSGSARVEYVAIGQRLREARERRGMSFEAALEILHCTPEVLQSLEQGRFERLGAAVFVRGHLKRYADLVGEPAEEVLGQWSAVGAGPAPDLTQRPQAPRPLALRQWGRTAAYVAVAIVLVALAWAVLRFAAPAVRSVAPAPAQPQALPALREPPPAPVIAPVAPATTATTVVAATEATLADTGNPAAAPTATVSSAAVAASSGPVAPTDREPAGRITVAGSFAEPCWVEVTDATGKRLYYGLAPAGGRLSLTGTAPFRVLLGVQSAATLEVGGRSVAIPAGAPGLRSTRFQLAADGTVLPPNN